MVQPIFYLYFVPFFPFLCGFDAVMILIAFAVFPRTKLEQIISYKNIFFFLFILNEIIWCQPEDVISLNLFVHLTFLFCLLPSMIFIIIINRCFGLFFLFYFRIEAMTTNDENDGHSTRSLISCHNSSSFFRFVFIVKTKTNQFKRANTHTHTHTCCEVIHFKYDFTLKAFWWWINFSFCSFSQWASTFCVRSIII